MKRTTAIAVLLGLILVAFICAYPTIATILRNNSFFAAVGTTQSTKTVAGVKAAVQARVPAGISMAFGATSIADIYALQVWTADDVAGEALLMYDSTNNQWNFVSWGGGAWSAEGLTQVEGVPQDTATALLKALPN